MFDFKIPEPDVEPAEERYVTAECGHECYAGEKLYMWENESLCPDCFLDKVRELSIDELAELLEVETVNI